VNGAPGVHFIGTGDTWWPAGQCPRYIDLYTDPLLRISGHRGHECCQPRHIIGGDPQPQLGSPRQYVLRGESPLYMAQIGHPRLTGSTQLPAALMSARARTSIVRPVLTSTQVARHPSPPACARCSRVRVRMTAPRNAASSTFRTTSRLSSTEQSGYENPWINPGLRAAPAGPWSRRIDSDARRPRPAASRAMPAPLIPPPTISRSTVCVCDTGSGPLSCLSHDRIPRHQQCADEGARKVAIRAAKGEGRDDGDNAQEGYEVDSNNHAQRIVHVER
jgi:hypothetical protein